MTGKGDRVSGGRGPIKHLLIQLNLIHSLKFISRNACPMAYIVK